MSDTSLNLLITLTPFVLVLISSFCILLNEVIENLQTYSFNNYYQQQQKDILIKKAHMAGLEAGMYYSKEYKQAYSKVIGQ